MKSTKPRVLLSAYQCGPGMGSVSQIGWHWYSRMAVQTPTTLVTHVRNREALEQAGAPLAGSEIIYIDTEWFAGPLYRFASKIFPKSQHAVFLVSSLDFYVYDHGMVRTLRDRSDEWDVVHAVTPVSPLAATRLHKLGLPLVLGPWNGGLASPPSFERIMRDDSGWFYPARNLGKAIDAIVGSTRNASVMLSATRATTESISEKYRDRCVALLENAVDLTTFVPSAWPSPPSAEQPLRICFVGRLVPFKGITMLLQALQQMRDEILVEAHVVGDGPLKDELIAEAQGRSVDDIVTFHGNLAPAAVAAEVRAAHVFCLPSVRESGGAVVLEAMASARPVVVVDYGGPAEIVDAEVGVALAPNGEDAVVAGLCETFRDVVKRPEHWRNLGAVGRARAEQKYSWDAKVAEAIGLYTKLLA
jgi:glycosyltransferase involved in cell wall biosynthesis